MSQNDAGADRYKLLDPNFPKNPYPVLHRMRAEEPVYWFAPLQTWVLTRYEDVTNVLKDPARFTANRAAQMMEAQLPPEAPPPFKQGMIQGLSLAAMFQDPPTHTAMRAEANKGFSPRAMAPMGPRIEKLTHELIDKVEGKGSMDGFSELFQPFSIRIITDIMGVPAQDQHLFADWTHRTTKLLSGARLTLEEAMSSAGALQEMNVYFVKLLEERRKNPTDDMTSYLGGSEHTSHFPPEALAGVCSEILGGAIAPTGDSLGNALLAILNNPGELEKLKRDPSLWANAIQELLRYDGPVVFWSRAAKEDVTLGGKQIKAGQIVSVSLAAANRDPEVFPEPDKLDISRNNSSKHVSFSYGPHYCVGAPLAKVEMNTVFDILFKRLPKLRLAGPITWREGSLSTRGPTSIPLAF